jgi:hypothetical protein
MLIDGQNNHNWKATTPVLKTMLEKSGRFELSVSTTAGANSPKAAWTGWHPHFKKFAGS